MTYLILHFAWAMVIQITVCFVFLNNIMEKKDGMIYTTNLIQEQNKLGFSWQFVIHISTKAKSPMAPVTVSCVLVMFCSKKRTHSHTAVSSLLVCLSDRSRNTCRSIRSMISGRLTSFHHVSLHSFQRLFQNSLLIMLYMVSCPRFPCWPQPGVRT